MARPGTKPKPTYLRILQGNPGKRPINQEEPQPEGDLLDPPAHFNDDQRAGWQYAIEHAPQGMLRMLDRAALAVFVVAEDLHAKATKAVADKGLLVRSRQNSTPYQNPYLAILNKQATIMMHAAAELGFTPSSRTRVGGGGGDDGNPFAAHGKRGS